MRPIGTQKQLEQRRKRAVELLKDGHGIREVARMVGVSPSSVVRWLSFGVEFIRRSVGEG